MATAEFMGVDGWGGLHCHICTNSKVDVVLQLILGWDNLELEEQDEGGENCKEKRV